MADVPDIRIRALNEATVKRGGEYVLYWMIAFRRTHWNFALQHAVNRARELGKPLIILEALRCSYRWASDRLHQFVIQGMADNARDLADKPALYYPYVEPRRGHQRGLLEALAENACLVVSDDFPCFFLPRMLRLAARKMSVPLEIVDANGLLPLRAAEKVFARAYDLRRFLQRQLPAYLEEAQFPLEFPLSWAKLPELDKLPGKCAKRWQPAKVETLADDASHLQKLPIDHSVGVAPLRGGAAAANERWQQFLARDLSRYADGRNHPDDDASSGLSPYLHFGHLSPHQVFRELAEAEAWSPDDLSSKASGSSEGWWGMSAGAEGFLDQLVTWRELGFNLCWQQEDYDRYESLPDWAQQTLAAHADDPREHEYSLEEFERAETHDELWNAAQRQLVQEGRMHNYLRMLWGKKILHWSESPQEAVEIMIELNNKYALDGRDPNSYSGIFWVLGRYDRPWGPQRPVFGKVRYMTSDSTRKKLRLTEYLERYGDGEG